MLTSCAWIIFADSPPPGTCRPGRRRPSPESGYPVRVRTSSARSRESWGLCRLLPRTWGVITPDVRALRDQFQLPGMRILQFAFDGHADNPYLPRIRWFTRAPTTTPRFAVGLKRCRRI